jgi:TRAP transporter 4TM/12TM fusion protein
VLSCITGDYFTFPNDDRAVGGRPPPFGRDSDSRPNRINHRKPAAFYVGQGEQVMAVEIKGFPEWQGVPRNAFTALGCLLSLFVLYCGIFGVPTNNIHRPICLGLGLMISYIVFPSGIFKEKSAPEALLNTILSLAAIGACIWVGTTWDRIELTVTFTRMDIFWGVMTIIVVLEATRRAVSMPLALLAVLTLIYAYVGPYIPGVLAHRGYNVQRIVAVASTGNEGIFSSVLGIVGAIIAIFLIFGAFMSASKGAQSFMDLATSLTGKAYGGPAKVAVIASGFMAMISGSAVANVATTGAATIPAMKKIGYPPHVSGAIEAVASSGGQKTPPLMGASAFVMSDLLGIPYLKVCACAMIPALLHYVSLFSQVHYKAVNMGIRDTSGTVPRLRNSLLNCTHLFAGFTVLTVLLLMQYSAGYCAIYAIGVLIFFSFFRRHSRMNVRGFTEALVGGARLAAPILSAGATAGLVLGMLSLTGLGAKLSEAIEFYSFGYSGLALFLTMVVSLVLGMGLPTLICYLILAVLVAPLLQNFGFSPLASHFYIFYFGVLSTLTPPLCLAAFTAASIAEAPMMKTGFTAVKLGMILYLLPYGFMYNAALIFEGGAVDILTHAILAVIGAWSLGVALEGFFYKKLVWFLRIIIGGSGIILLFYINLKLVVVALIALGCAYFFERSKKLQRKTQPEVA